MLTLFDNANVSIELAEAMTEFNNSVYALNEERDRVERELKRYYALIREAKDRLEEAEKRQRVAAARVDVEVKKANKKTFYPMQSELLCEKVINFNAYSRNTVVLAAYNKAAIKAGKPVRKGRVMVDYDLV